MHDEASRYRAAINALVKRAKAYAKHRRVTVGYVSKLLFSHGQKIEKLANGGALTPEAFDAAVQKLDALEAALTGQVA